MEESIKSLALKVLSKQRGNPATADEPKNSTASPAETRSEPEKPAPKSRDLVGDLFRLFESAVKQKDFNSAARLAHELIAARAIGSTGTDVPQDVVIKNGEHACPACGQRLRPIEFKVSFEDADKARAKLLDKLLQEPVGRIPS
jgi:hypothetical protein